jgi:UDP:flavonoid glycosyltransferase YjiC (YdhE family)
VARVVLACWGSYGDLFPTLGLAAALKARGHAPLVAASRLYADLVAKTGADFAPVGPEVDPGDLALMARVMNPRTGSEVIVRELLVPAIRDSYADLTEAARGADLLVSHPVTFAAPLVAQKQGLRWLSTVLAPTSLFSIHDFPLVPPMPGLMRLARLHPLAARMMLAMAHGATKRWTAPIRAFRAELGLPAAPDPLYAGQFSPFGTLALFSRVLAEPQPDWPPNSTLTGFVFHADDEAMDQELQAFLDAGDPPIVFTLGTSAVSAPGGFYRESVKAATALGRRAVLLIGRHDENRPPLPPTMRAVPYAPHAPLFARASVIVHHGGAGTTAQALRAGRPMLVVPHAHDQPDNAARVERAGAGRAIPASRYRSDRVVTHLETLLKDPACARGAADAAAVVRSENGAGLACEAIEHILKGGAGG